MIKTLTNAEIYTYTTGLLNILSNSDRYFSAKINFILQKNKNTLLQYAQEIENSRMEIIKKFGTPTEGEEKYEIPEDKVEEVNKELLDLLSISQEVQVLTFPLKDIEELAFTPTEMENLMFMIEEA